MDFVFDLELRSPMAIESRVWQPGDIRAEPFARIRIGDDGTTGCYLRSMEPDLLRTLAKACTEAADELDRFLPAPLRRPGEPA